MVTAVDLDTARMLVGSVVDPEIPTVTIADLGILRDVRVVGDHVTVVITPTYSGCPAMTQIADDIRAVLAGSGVDDVEIETVYSPAWTTDWITDEARERLQASAISPPAPIERAVCPRCQAADAQVVSEFGSTACKALLVCSGCGEPFDLFKELR